MQLDINQKRAIIKKLEQNDYKFLDILGKGGDGEVFLVQSITNCRQFAIKCFNNERDFVRLKPLADCPNLIVPIGCIEVNANLFIYFMEKCTPIKQSFPSTKKLLLDILDGIEQLDKKGFEQKDGFDGNILLRKNQSVAISDFSSFGTKDNDSIKRQIEKMLEYVQKSRDIKDLIDSLTESDKNSVVKTKNKINSLFK